ALAVVAPKAPTALRIFLLTLAVADDLGAVVLIALLFSHNLALLPLAAVAALLAGLALVGRWRAVPPVVYVVGAVLVWAFALSSGVHTSVAGVAAAFTVPLA